MDYGLTLPGAGSLASERGIVSVATAGEERGFTSVWAADHVAIPLQTRSRYPYAVDGNVMWPAGRPWLDPFLSLGLVGSSTRKMRLGLSVLVLPLRHPLAAAKMAGTLDYLFSGRLILGIGAGWLAEEFVLLGQPFEDRYERTAEGIEVMRACWGPDPVEYRGHHFELPPFAMSPKPVQGQGLPVLIGGQGDRSLQLVARAGDGWHPLNLSPAEYENGLGKLERLMAEAGRHLSDLMLTAVVDSTVVTARDQVEDYASLGVELLVLDVDYSSGSIAVVGAEMERLSTALGL